MLKARRVGKARDRTGQTRRNRKPGRMKPRGSSNVWVKVRVVEMWDALLRKESRSRAQREIEVSIRYVDCKTTPSPTMMSLTPFCTHTCLGFVSARGPFSHVTWNDGEVEISMGLRGGLPPPRMICSGCLLWYGSGCRMWLGRSVADDDQLWKVRSAIDRN
jgi:hypothetical protein